MKSSIQIGGIVVLVIFFLFSLSAAFAKTNEFTASTSVNITNVTMNLTNVIKPTLNITNNTNATMPSNKKNVTSHTSDLNRVGSKPAVTLTLYVHERFDYGRIIPEATVSGQDGAGNSFEGTTNDDGFITIKGYSGNWSFIASAPDYYDKSWTQAITETRTIDAFLKVVSNPVHPLPLLQSSTSTLGSDLKPPVPKEIPRLQSSASTLGSDLKTPVPEEMTFGSGGGGGVVAGLDEPVTLTLYVHGGNIDGPIVSGASITGQDGKGNNLNGITNGDGFAKLIGYPGSWSFKAFAQGYQDKTWYQRITDTCTNDVSL